MSSYRKYPTKMSLEPCDLEWKIENFGALLAENYESIRSPMFSVHNVSTVWYFQLDIIHLNPLQIRLNVQLYRHVFDSGPQKVMVSFNLDVLTFNRDLLWYLPIIRTQFQRGSCCGGTFETTIEFLGNLPKNDSRCDVLVILCKMLLCERDDFVTYNNPNQDLLATDFMRLLNGTDGKNAVIVAESEAITVHKEILAAYSAVFNAHFRSGFCRVDLPFSLETIRIMLKLIYTGEIKEIINDFPPHFELYNLAKEYGICILKQIFKPLKTISCVTIIKTKTFSSKVVIPNFIQVLETAEIAKIVLEFDNFTLVIKPYFQRDCAPRQLILHGEVLNLTNVACLTPELSYLDEFGIEIFVLPLQGWLYPSFKGKCKFVFSLPEKTIFRQAHSLLNQQSLVINLSCKVIFLEEVNILQKKTDNQDNIVNDCKGCSFHKHMTQLLENDIFQDIDCSISNITIKVHEVHDCILSIRAPALQRSISNKLISVPHQFSLDIIKRLLKYLYTGCLEIQNHLDIIQIYIVANYYEIEGLKNKCRDLLHKIELSTKNIFDISLWSHNFNDWDLKSKCYKFIFKNVDILFDKPTWLNLKIQDENLSEDILIYIKNSNNENN